MSAHNGAHHVVERENRKRGSHVSERGRNHCLFCYHNGRSTSARIRHKPELHKDTVGDQDTTPLRSAMRAAMSGDIPAMYKPGPRMR
jgi:hypothetical protein